jgi:hypothetical protein
MRLRVLHHDHCFDGCASAAIFSEFHRAVVDPAATLEIAGLTHRPGGAFDANVLSGDENAILDFRFSSSPKLTWWFDHHVSAFPTPEDEAAFRADASGKKFFDPTAKSCTKFMANVLTERFGFDTSRFTELIDWAELIDGALFTSARQAVELAEPALKIMATLEATTDHDLSRKVVVAMTEHSVGTIAASPLIAAPFEKIFAAHWAVRDRIQAAAHEDGGVVLFDLADQPIEAFNKFIAYELFPGSRYTVAVTRSKSRSKVSVGSNPWAPVPRTHDIAALCSRYGGGGHPVVGAVSFGPDELERARQVAAEIAAELRS